MSLPGLPPGRALKAGAVVATPIVVACALGGWVGGLVAVLGITLGVAAGVQAAVADVPWSLRLPVVVVVPVVGALAAVASDSALLSALVVGVAAVAQWPVNERAAGIGVFWPALAALVASVGVEGWWPLAGWLVVGAALVVGIAAVLGVRAPVTGVTRDVAGRHAVATAIAAGVATYLTLALGIGHGYWLVLTLVMVLRPVRGETARNALDRTLGTLVGVVLGVAAVLLLPLAVSLVFLLACFVLTVAWALAGNVRMQTVFTTPMVVLIGSAGLAGSTVGLALDRLLLVSAGAVVAVGLAVLLHRLDASPTRD
ncbi:MAG: FUSC family protein [Nocardioidaceae bacterium]